MDARGTGQSPGAAPLPPLGDLSTTGQGDTSSPTGAASGGLAAAMSGLMPIKEGVKQILAGCQTIVGSQVVPGSEQVCSQIIALATSLLPMAAQAILQPGANGGSIGPVQGGAPPQPPPGM